MDKRRRAFSPVMGAASLLVMFAVLCMVVFALLGLSTVQADRNLSDASADAVSDYYAADRMAEQIYSQLRRGIVPDEVTEQDGVYTYACTISDTQVLAVAVRREGDEWTVLQWKAMSTADWEADQTLNLWDGELDS